MVLCAGLGTRLRPLTLEVPKPLIPVLGKPLAAYALDQLKRIGVSQVVANTHHLGALVEPTLRPFTNALSMSLQCIHEPVLLGTGGGIRNALPLLGTEPFVVFNGDILAAPDLQRALKLHHDSNARMTMILREDPQAQKHGAIEVDSEGRVRRMLGEGPVSEVPTKSCMFTGIYVLSPDVREDLPENGCIVRHTLRRWLARGDRVSAIIDDGPWYDLGTTQAYAEVMFRALDGRLVLAGFSSSDRSQWIHPTAKSSSSVTLADHVALSENVVVQGEGTLHNVIAWPGATVNAPLQHAIVSSAGVVVAIPER